MSTQAIKDYKSFRAVIDQRSALAHDLVQEAESCGHVEDMRQVFMQKHKDLGFEHAVWQAFWLNIDGMRGVVRKTGSAYATHPLTVAFIAYELMGQRPEAHQTAALCLLHDYLEEGPGFSTYAFEKLKGHMNLFKDAAIGAVVLSEPAIDYSGYAHPKRVMEYVAYVQQVIMLQGKVPEYYYNTSLADKLHNSHCWDYIVNSPKFADEAKRREKIGLKLGHYSFVNFHLRDDAAAAFGDVLAQSIEYHRQEFSFSDEDLYKAFDKLEAIRLDNERTLVEQIEAYHDKMGVWKA